MVLEGLEAFGDVQVGNNRMKGRQWWLTHRNQRKK